MFIRKACLPLLLLIAFSTASSRASDDLESTALTLAPKDASFFFTSVNMGDAWDDFLNGNLIRRVRSVPYVQKVEAVLMEQWENPPPEIAQAKAVVLSPSAKKLIQLGQDMFHDEAFIYGGEDWCETMEFVALFQSGFYYAVNQGPEAVEAFMQDEFPEIIKSLKVPTTVMGFRIEDQENAALQLDALGGLIQFGVGSIPEAEPFLSGLVREEYEDGQSLTFTIDESMFSPEMFDGDERAYQAVMSVMKGRKISIGIGIKAGMLVLVSGENDKIISELGSQASSLLENDALAVLKDASPTNLRSITYVSEDFRDAGWQANFDGYFERIAGQMAALRELPGMDEAGLVDQIQEDAAWMDEKLAEITPDFGPQLGWAHTNDQRSAIFTYSYDWTEGSAFENAEPMTITKHAGSDPLALFAFKQRDIPFLREMVEYGLKVAPDRIKSLAAVNVDNDAELEMIGKVVDRVMAIVNEGYGILVEQIGPAMADNESLISIAGQWKTDFLGPGVPAPSRPVPLPEIAGAAKLSDKAAFLSGCEELFNVMDQLVDVVREVNPNSVPADYRIPRPEAEETANGTKFSYPQISGQVPLDGFDLQVFVTDDAVIYGYSERQIGDMAEAKSLASKPAWLGEDDAVAGVTFIDFAGMFASVRPWAEFGFEVSGFGVDTPIPLAPPFPELTGNDLLQLWDCLDAAGKAAGTVVVDEELGATVTRSVWVGQ